MLKKISIITVVYNRREDLITTIKSVLPELTDEAEFVVIDGGSTDGTTTILKEYSRCIDVMKSEPDRGIFDAMNKGIKASSGQWLIFINAGDELVSGSLAAVDFNAYDHCGMIYGNTVRTSVGVTRPFQIEKIETGSMPVCHQSIFYNRRVLGDEMYYNIKFSLFGENELMMRIYAKNIPLSYVDLTISKFQEGGISSTINNRVRRARYYFLYKHFGIGGVVKGILHKLKLIKYSTQ